MPNNPIRCQGTDTAERYGTECSNQPKIAVIFGGTSEMHGPITHHTTELFCFQHYDAVLEELGAGSYGDNMSVLAATLIGY